MTSQFEIKETRNEGFEYDYRSIMHYPAWAFSKKPLNKSVIVAKNPFVQYLIDEEKDSLSFRDIKLTNMLYKCHDKCPNIGVTECKNNGFLMYKSHKKTCLCRCPPGINGKNCELNEENKIDLYKPKCGGHITKQGQFWTPNYPNRKHPYESCSYWIQAPDEHTVEVTFHDFSFNEPYFGENNEAIEGLCLHETIEIRNLDNIYDGNQYCGQQITRNTIMNSIGKDFIIIIIADDQMIGRGLNASIRFIKNDSNEEILQISPKSRPRRVNTNKLKQNVNQLEISDIIGI
ncbi:blastula protease 10-like [Oppia nitens]|uniref:blastula protease 10-like n=1 Tax=Oppia nitens TaxID=1686743 RepID=UPI0023DC70FA|nr:blastula protease 10-like [Oppia nitens]